MRDFLPKLFLAVVASICVVWPLCFLFWWRFTARLRSVRPNVVVRLRDVWAWGFTPSAAGRRFRRFVMHKQFEAVGDTELTRLGNLTRAFTLLLLIMMIAIAAITVLGWLVRN